MGVPQKKKSSAISRQAVLYGQIFQDLIFVVLNADRQTNETNAYCCIEWCSLFVLPICNILHSDFKHLLGFLKTIKNSLAENFKTFFTIFLSMPCLAGYMNKVIMSPRTLYMSSESHIILLFLYVFVCARVHLALRIDEIVFGTCY